MNKDASSFEFNVYSYCSVMDVLCLAPDTSCPHWQGTFCDMEDTIEDYFRWYEGASDEE